MRNKLNRWLNCRAVLTICSKKMIACGLDWKENILKMHKGIATLHPWANKIKARSLSGQTTTMQQRMMSYLLVALHFQICHPQRTTWRLSQGRGPHAVPTDLSAPCLIEYRENSAERGGSQNTPLKTYQRGNGAQHRHFRLGIPPSKMHQPRICLHPLLFEDLKICCPPHWVSIS